MFDITSFIREKIFRRPKLVIQAGEELSEKQTTKLGYFLLYCMFVAILMSAQWTLSIIHEIPTKPTMVPNCVSNLLDVLEPKSSNYSFREDTYNYNYGGYYGGYNYNGCNLVSTTPRYDFTESYNALREVGLSIQTYGDELQALESQRNSTSYKLKDSRDQYNTALIENISEEEERAYNKDEVRETVKGSEKQLTDLEKKINEKKEQIEAIRSENQGKRTTLNIEYQQAESDYKTAYLMYRLIVAVLSLGFAALVFSVLYRIYIRQKIANSPHAIIFSVATFAYGLVLLQITGMFLWDIIPHKFFALLMEFLVVFKPILYLVQFLWPILIIAVFGYLVFRIQKRLYSPQNVLKRFISDKKCPNCGNAVDFTKPFCPLCAHEIQIDCPHCHVLTLKGMPFCSSCGGKLPESNAITHNDKRVFDSALAHTLDSIDITPYSGVTFTGVNGESFTMKRANVIRLAVSITTKFQKTDFAPGELLPVIHDVLSHITDKLPKSEIERVTGRIHAWAEAGGKVEFIQK